MALGIQHHFAGDPAVGTIALQAVTGMSYELRFKDHGGRTFSLSRLRAASDQQAIDKARRVYRCGIGDHYEIWREDVLIHVEAERSQLGAPA